jgi:hypothetical protein
LSATLLLVGFSTPIFMAQPASAPDAAQLAGFCERRLTCAPIAAILITYVTGQ